ncbi:MAG: hypothetical protein HQK91_11705 [Nitrospirae bacterium]|nr:hypothetical protein [Nitrospirota bacterium]
MGDVQEGCPYRSILNTCKGMQYSKVSKTYVNLFCKTIVKYETCFFYFVAKALDNFNAM